MSVYVTDKQGKVVGGGVNTAMLPPGAPIPSAPEQAPRPAAGLKMPAPSQGYNCEARVRQLEAELARLRGVGGGFEEAFQQSMSDNQNRIAEYRKGLAGAGPSGALGGLVG